MVSPSIHRFAGIFIITSSGKIIGQQRDNIPNIDNPGKVAPFGGTVEQNEEPKQAAWRELVQEETNLNISINQLKLIHKTKAIRDLTKKTEEQYFYLLEITDEQLDNIKIYEGQGWCQVKSSNDPNLATNFVPAWQFLFDYLKNININ